MFKIAMDLLKTFDQALYLTRVAKGCKDYEELNRLALGVLRGQPADKAERQDLESQDGESRQLAA